MASGLLERSLCCCASGSCGAGSSMCNLDPGLKPVREEGLHSLRAQAGASAEIQVQAKCGLSMERRLPTGDM